MTSTSREQLGLAFGFAGVLLFGGTLPATRVAVAALDPLFLSTARASIAGLLRPAAAACVGPAVADAPSRAGALPPR